jgi:HSP20 family protein
MNLIPWKNVFEGLLGPETDARPTAWVPVMDIHEGEKDYTVRVELPGVDPSQVELNVEGTLLTLRGEKKDVRETESKGFRRTECVYGAFERSLMLPEGVDSAAIAAEGANGVLTVRIPKVPAAAARRIQIQAK